MNISFKKWIISRKTFLSKYVLFLTDAAEHHLSTIRMTIFLIILTRYWISQSLISFRNELYKILVGLWKGKRNEKNTVSKPTLLFKTRLPWQFKDKTNTTEKSKTPSTWIRIFIRMVLNRESPIILLYFRIQSTRLQSQNSIRIENLNLIKTTKNKTPIKSNIQNPNITKTSTKNI